MDKSMTARCPRPIAAKHHQPSTTVLMSYCADMACLVFFECVRVKNLQLGLICPKEIVPEVLLFVQV